MVKIKDKTFSGSVFDNNDEEVTVIIYSDYSVHDIAQFMLNAAEIISYSDDGNEIVHKVTHAKSCSEVSSHVYSLKYSTRPTVEERLEAQVASQSEIIDTLLALVLEG